MTDRVGVLERFLRHEARVHPAHHHRDAARPEGVGDLVAAVHVAGHRGDADEVGLEIEVDRLDVLVGQHDLVAGRGDGRRDGQEAGEGE